MLATLATPAAFASGSAGWGQESETDYDLGKKVFMEKVVCESCPYADVVIDEDAVAEILPQLSREGSIGYNLSYRERQSVISFIEKRYNL